MLQKPNIVEQELIDCLRENYALRVSDIEFLPLGADRDTVVYRARANQSDYFVKLRSNFDEMSILVPAFLHEQGIKQVIAPLKTQSQALWTQLRHYILAVFPFVDGQNAYDTHMSDQQLIEFGQTLKNLHSATLPSRIEHRIQREDYADSWRKKVRQFQDDIESNSYRDAVSIGLVELLQNHQDKINRLVEGAAHLADILITKPRPFVLCHADIHVWNVLISQDNHFYIIDWDTVVLAPIERDLMFIGSGLGGKWNTAHEQALFYQGYGQVKIDPVGLAYYRMERIVQDIVAYCETILLTDEGEDRAVGLAQLTSQFKSGGIVDIALEGK